MIDVQHRSLGALKHHAAACGQHIRQQLARIGYQGPQLICGSRIFVVHLLGVQRISPK